MKITKSQNFVRAVQMARKVSLAVRNAGMAELACELDAQIEVAENEKFVIGVVGSTRRGKSTLVNGLLGRKNDDCAPIGKFPATNVVSIFGHSETSSVHAVLSDGSKREITESEIRLYVTEDHNPNNFKNVRSVEVLGPFSRLEPGVYLVDTPGANNALSARHGELLLEFLPVAAAVIFMVTADEPLTEPEKKLLRSIHGHDTKKLFFAVNKVDRIESGDLEREELAEGIDHNRQILADVGFPDARIYPISAKCYFEKHSDAGTERLLADIQKMVAAERFAIIEERLRARAQLVLDTCHTQLEVTLGESRATKEELETEHSMVLKTRDDLCKGRAQRERQFAQEWDDAFDELNGALRVIRNQLGDEYSALIERTADLNVPSLTQTIHSDVAISFSERLKPKMVVCEARLTEAQRNMTMAVSLSFLKGGPTLRPGSTNVSILQDGLKVGGAALPALIGGIVSASLPGLVGSVMAAATPAVVAATWNPLTWLPALFSAGGATVLTGTSAVTVSALSVIALPLSVGIFGLATWRAYSSWKGVRKMQKNELQSKVITMVDDGCDQVASQFQNYRKGKDRVLREFNELLEQEILRADMRLVGLMENRPSPETIQRLEESIALIGNQEWRLQASTDNETPLGTAQMALIDSVLSKDS